MLFNISTLQWDEKLLDVLHIPRSVLPEVLPSSGHFGRTAAGIFGHCSVPITGMAGDQQAALFGQKCFAAGEAKNTYGTGCFMLMNTGSRLVHSKSGLLSTIAWQIGSEVNYALEGSVFIAGAAIKWLRDGLKIIDQASDTEKIAYSVADSHGVYVVPAFTGLGAPYWDMYARGAILGLTQGVTEKHLVRATLESLAYQTSDIIRAMEIDSGIKLKKLKVDGGASANSFIMQFQSDILHTDVVCLPFPEATAFGAALLAGLAIGLYQRDGLKADAPESKVYKPNMGMKERKQLYSGWLKAVERAKHWAKE
jgi:glycerol kinase